MATKRRGTGRWKGWTKKKLEKLNVILDGGEVTDRELKVVERLLRAMRSHKAAERKRKRTKRKRVWATKPGR